MLFLLAMLGCGGGSVELIVFPGPCCDGTPLVHDGYLVGWGWLTDSIDSGAGFGTYHFDSAMVVGRQSVGIIGGAPALGADDMILVPGEDLLALVPGGGTYWSQYLPGMATTPVSIGSDGTVWVGTDAGAVFAFDRDGNPVASRGLANLTPIGRVAVGPDGAAYGFAAGPDVTVPRWVLFAVEPDGTLRYSIPVDLPLAQIALLGDGSLVAGFYHGPELDIESEAPDWSLVDVTAFDAQTGEVRWAFPIDDQPSTAVETERGEVVVTTPNELIGIDEDGGEAFRNTDAGILGEPTVGDDGRIYVGCEVGVCVYDRRGNLDIAYDLPVPAYLPVALYGGYVVANSDRTLIGIPLDEDVRTAPTWARAGADNRGTGAR